MDTNGQSEITEVENPIVIKEIPSSLPWERSPSDGIGDAWPSSQSDSSPVRLSQRSPPHHSQPRYEDGFRVPHPPSSKMSQMGLDSTHCQESQPHILSQITLGSTQSEESQPHARSQVTLGSTQSEESESHARASQDSQRRPSGYSTATLDNTQLDEDPLTYDQYTLKESAQCRINTFRGPDITAMPKTSLDDNQDSVQDESQLQQLDAKRKRKRAATVTDIPDSTPKSNSQLPRSPKKRNVTDAPIDDSCVILCESQIPQSMRKQPREYIKIHSTQSQTQDYHAPPAPMPTSQDLDKPFGAPPTGSEESSPSLSQPPGHMWDSPRATASPVGPPVHFSCSLSLPSHFQFINENEIPGRLAITSSGLPKGRVLADLSELDKMKERDEMDLKTKEIEKYTPEWNNY